MHAFYPNWLTIVHNYYFSLRSYCHKVTLFLFGKAASKWHVNFVSNTVVMYYSNVNFVLRLTWLIFPAAPKWKPNPGQSFIAILISIGGTPGCNGPLIKPRVKPRV